MAKRPEFNLPSTDAAPAAPKTEWVYRSDGEAPVVAAPIEDVSTSDAIGTAVVETLKSESDLIIARYSRYAAGIGLVPLPFADFVFIGSVQLRMIGALATHYGLPFDRQLAKSMLASAAASMGATSFGYRTGRSLLKAIPVIGNAAAIVAVPLSAYAVTTALGKIFATHFANGGKLCDFAAETHV
jgi:uncharacterized protein (DUF697 family)